MKSLRIFASLAVLLFLVPIGSANAAEVQTGKTVFIQDTSAIQSNAYLVGGDVHVAAPSEKDLLSLGGKILIAAPVAGDLMLGGGTIDVLDEVDGDVRIAGGDVRIAKHVGGDLVVLGGTVTVLPGSVIGGDVIIFGGTVDIEGDVNGALTVRGDDVIINSIVAGSAVVTAGKGVTFGERSVFGNTLSYTAPVEATVSSGANLGTQVVFTKEGVSKEHNFAGTLLSILGILILVKFVGILLAALFVVLVFKKALVTLSLGASENFLRMVGIGFLATVVPPIAIVLLALSFVGLYLAFIVGALYLFALLCGGIVMCILAGVLLSKWIKKETHVDWRWTILGTLAVFILGLIPIIGWALVALLFFAAMGAVATSIHRDAKAKM